MRSSSQDPTAGGFLSRCIDLVVHRWRAPFVALSLLALAVITIILLGDGERGAKATDQLPSGKDSTSAVRLMSQLPDTDDAAIAVFESTSGTLTPAVLKNLRDVAKQVGASPGVEGDVTPSPDTSLAIASVPIKGASDAERIAAVKRLRADLNELTPDGVTASVTGPDAVSADLDAVFDGANTKLLGATAAVVALLLVITYRSPLLFIIPLLVVGVADRLASVVATHVMAGLDVAFNDGTTSILSILVFGAGTDYALLLISRYKAELTTHPSRYTAMAVALRRTAEAVLTSAVTVVLGVLTLILSLTPSTRALGVASAIGITVVSAFVLVVLPAALVSFGRWVFWPVIPRASGNSGVSADDAAHRTVWFRVGTAVARRPRAVIAGTLAVVAVASTGLFGISLGLNSADSFPDKPESVRAAERLGQSFPAGLSDPVRIVTREDGQKVANVVADVDGVDSATVTEQGNGVTLVDAVLDVDPGNDAQAVVGKIRTALDATPDTFVGGTEAQALDAKDSTQRDLLVIIPAVTILVMLVLGGILRSIAAPIILVGTVVITYAAALGAAWWIFTSIFDYPALDNNVPVIGFVFLVALGVDYNIFLVTRAREESAARGTRRGMLHALGATGGVITSAGILLAAVFTVLGLLPAVGLAQIGVVICSGVLLDTLLIRTVLVPAVALILGDRFWWPRQVEKGTPADTSHPTLEGALHD